jgi:DNA-binding MarR family transcriptional regulator
LEDRLFCSQVRGCMEADLKSSRESQAAPLKLGYTNIESAVIRSPVLSATEKHFYVVLKDFRNRKNGRCFPTMRRIAKRAGLSSHTVYKVRKRLEDVGLIQWETVRGRRKSCSYSFPLLTGSNEEIERILERLSGGKILQISTKKNTANQQQGNRANQQQKIQQNSSTKHKSLNTGILNSNASDTDSLSAVPHGAEGGPLQTMPSPKGESCKDPEKRRELLRTQLEQVKGGSPAAEAEK